MTSKSKTNTLSFDDDVDNEVFNTITTLIPPPPPPPPTNIKSKKKSDRSKSSAVPTNPINNQTDLNSPLKNHDILSSNQLPITSPITTNTVTATNKPITTNFHTLNKTFFTKRGKNQADKLLLAQAEMNKFNFMQISSDILIQTELTIEKNQQEQLNNSTNNVNDDNLSPNNRDRNRQYTTSTYDL